MSFLTNFTLSFIELTLGICLIFADITNSSWIMLNETAKIYCLSFTYLLLIVFFLLIQLGKMRMTIPCRASTCTHLQCFDAATFLLMNEKKPTWICPVCDKPAPFDKLIIDGYICIDICMCECKMSWWFVLCSEHEFGGLYSALWIVLYNVCNLIMCKSKILRVHQTLPLFLMAKYLKSYFSHSLTLLTHLYI